MLPEAGKINTYVQMDSILAGFTTVSGAVPNALNSSPVCFPRKDSHHDTHLSLPFPNHTGFSDILSKSCQGDL